MYHNSVGPQTELHTRCLATTGSLLYAASVCSHTAPPLLPHSAEIKEEEENAAGYTSGSARACVWQGMAQVWCCDTHPFEVSVKWSGTLLCSQDIRSYTNVRNEMCLLLAWRDSTYKIKRWWQFSSGMKECNYWNMRLRVGLHTSQSQCGPFLLEAKMFRRKVSCFVSPPHRNFTYRFSFRLKSLCSPGDWEKVNLLTQSRSLKLRVMCCKTKCSKVKSHLNSISVTGFVFTYMFKSNDDGARLSGYL